MTATPHTDMEHYVMFLKTHVIGTLSWNYQLNNPIPW